MGERIPRVGILISGRGSNMLALVRAMREGRVRAAPAVVVSNVPGAVGLASAEALEVPVETVDSEAIRPREAHERAVASVLERHHVEWVCLAGYMRRLSPWLVSRYRERILNVHPALLPAFPGLDAQRQALEHGVKISGCTVHVVDEELDHGPIVLQAAVPVRHDDTVESLSARILSEEHRIYPEALALVTRGPVRIEGRRVLVP